MTNFMFKVLMASLAVNAVALVWLGFEVSALITLIKSHF